MDVCSIDQILLWQASLVGLKGVRTVMDTSLKEQGPTTNFNCGLRTRSISMAVADYIRVEKPIEVDVSK